MCVPPRRRSGPVRSTIGPREGVDQPSRRLHYCQSAAPHQAAGRAAQNQWIDKNVGPARRVSLGHQGRRRRLGRIPMSCSDPGDQVMPEVPADSGHRRSYRPRPGRRGFSRGGPTKVFASRRIEPSASRATNCAPSQDKGQVNSMVGVDRYPVWETAAPRDLLLKRQVDRPH